MAASHRRGEDTARRHRKARLLIVTLAPLLVLPPLPSSASAQAGAQDWSQSWSPPLALLTNGSSAGFLNLSYSMATLGSQTGTATATFKTAWVDVKALTDGPNVMQHGLSVQPAQFKLQIMHGPNPADHRGNCHVRGAHGHVLAFGPSIDVADGQWHTITCIKYADTAKGTQVVVIVDGIPGKPKWSRTPIGTIAPAGPVRLGGRSSRTSTDSLDGWISSVGFVLS